MNRVASELRKIWTIRSTYLILLIMLGLGVGLFSFYIIGFRNVGQAERSSQVLLTAIQQPMGLVALLLGILAIISVGHEYRYNTILYSLTSARQRLAVLASKFAALTISALIIAVVMFGLCIAGFYAGQQVAGITTVAQTTPGWDVTWRMLAQAMVYVVFGFTIAVIVRSLIAATAIILLVPSTVEGLLFLLLKEDTKYLPFTAAANLADVSSRVPVGTSAAVVAGYVVLLLGMSALLFQRRDAN